MILVTGAAGFIGFNLCRTLLNAGETIVGIDSVNEYYDPLLKQSRLAILEKMPGFTFKKMDLCDFDTLSALFEKYPFKKICHLAAQAGVRYSLTHPFAYQKSNNEGFLNIIELARRHSTGHFVYASSSSVYGANTKLPFSEDDPVNQPLSLYAATKRSNELTAHCYTHLFGLPTTGLRFFTVYGPWGRPDMALFLFTKAILAGEPIDVFNEGKMKRNFTYVDDIVQGIRIALDHPDGFKVYNLGNDRAENLMDFIAEIEQQLGMKAAMNFLPMQPGDVPATVADISRMRALGYEPQTNIDTGVGQFISWYRDYYR